MNIKNYNKAEVLAALYNKAEVQGMGIFQAVSGDMTQEEAEIIFKESPDKYFDYLKGRAMKVSLAQDEVETRLYNRYNGDGVAERIIEAL